jgi:hypothetical protein
MDHSYDGRYASRSIGRESIADILGPFNDWNLYRPLQFLSRARISNLHTPRHPTSESETRMQQATVNLLADMGVQPATLHEALIPAVSSTDRTPSTSMLSIPSNMLARALDGSVTITGIAQDEAGRVAGVEVSTDHGATWHPAEGRERCSLLGSHVALDR